MRSNTLAVLALLLLVFGGAAFWAKRRNERPTQQRRLFSGDAAKIQRITLTRPSGTVELARRKDGWDLKAPMEYPADMTAMQQLLENLSASTLSEPLSSAPEKAATFGLSPETEIRVQADGPQPLDLRVGKAGVDADSLYVRLGEAPAVYESRGLARYDVERATMDWLAKGIVSIPYTEVQQVVLKSTYTVTLQKSSDTWSFVEKDLPMLTTPGSPLNEVLGFLHNLEADGLLLAPPPGKPTLEVRVRYTHAGAPGEETLYFWPKVGNIVPVARKGETRVYYVLYPFKADPFRRPVSEFH